MKNTMGKPVLPIILGIFVITACIIGCSGKKTETSAPKEKADILENKSTIEQAEAIIEPSVTEPVEENI